MATYYCYRCARSQGHVNPVDPTLLIGLTQYQLDKYVKHTAPTGIYPTNSVFSSPDWSQYHNYMVAGAASGCLEIDNNRKNLIYFAGKETGLKDNLGVYSATCSGVKLVCTEDGGKLHAFPIDFVPESRTCAHCGAAVPFDPS